ncbi:hypothetical protein NUW58_g8448 [Xylaria curta]|uniref:Uncharacterized protein n=1 Tax=Xylaria curta TaxID=42375 RepID=A0ACC1N912_9PEZI|nr:hypothetical protein NUW58_g8448 [Xylaria curta]
MLILLPCLSPAFSSPDQRNIQTNEGSKRPVLGPEPRSTEIERTTLTTGTLGHASQRLESGSLTVGFAQVTGAANIADKEIPTAPRTDKDFVPAEAVRPSMEGDFHTGRGGAANVVRAPETQGESAPAPAAAAKPSTQGLADKLKNKIFGVFKK